MNQIRTWCAAAGALVVSLAVVELGAQKNKPAPGIPAQAWFVDSVDAGTGIQPNTACVFTGTISTDTGHFTATAPGCAVTFDDGTFEGVPMQPGTSGVAESLFVRNVGKVVAGTPLAGQFGLAWKDAMLNLPYRLAWGDAFDASIDYAYIKCTDVGAPCTQWTVSSHMTIDTPTREGNLRTTGPDARLTVVTGSGAKGVKVLASPLHVKYELEVRSLP